MSHTPLPWRLATVDREENLVLETDHAIVATVEWISPEETRANGELIARAVSCHDELLAACKAALTDLESYGYAEVIDDPAYAIAQQLKAAIAKAAR